MYQIQMMKMAILYYKEYNILIYFTKSQLV